MGFIDGTKIIDEDNYEYILYKDVHIVGKKCCTCGFNYRLKSNKQCVICKSRYKRSERGRFLRRKYTHNRRLKKNGTFEYNDWIDTVEYYDNCCLSCGVEFTTYEENMLTSMSLDHINPISNGGTNTIDNLQPICFRCNSSKGTKHIDYRSGYWINKNFGLMEII